MRKIYLVCGLILVVLSCLLLVTRTTSQPSPKTQQAAPTQTVLHTAPPTRVELLALVNAERQRNGVAPLVEDSRLDQSSQEKAQDEVTYNYFGHISPHTGQNSHDWIFATGISCIDSGENLTENTHINDSQHAINAWIASPPHHAAMINPKFSLTGFGIEGTQIVEHFCEQ